MKRNELRALGMTPEQIDAVMKLNGDDVNRLKADTVTKSSKEAQRLRESCVVLLELLDSPGSRARHPAARFPPVL